MKIQALHARNLLLILCALTFTACGFQLRGLSELSFRTLYIEQKGESVITKELKRSITNSGIQVVSSPENAEMLLDIMGESTDKRILSLSGSGKVKEYELIYRVNFRTRAASNPLWGEPQDVEIRRDYSYDDTQILGKEGEEARLRNDMRTDAVREIMRRLNAQKPITPSPAN